MIHNATLLNAAVCAALFCAVSGPAAIAQPFFEAFEPFDPQGQSHTRVIRTGSLSGGSFLGVGIQEVDTDRAKALKLREEAGVEITRIEDDSPAAKAGLKVGDVILQYNGQRVEGIEQFSRFVRETPPGREVRLGISREGAAQTLTAKIGARKGDAMVFPAMPRIEIPAMPDGARVFSMWRTSVLGIEGEALRGQLAEFFGTKEGVLVRTVSKDTPAEKAGIRAGDVIVKVNDVKVASPSDISSALRSLKGKTSVPVVLVRDKREMTVNASIEEGKSGWDSTPPAIRITGRGVRM